MSKIIGMMLVRNESKRWLKEVLDKMSAVCDQMIFIDDCSTDDTPIICQKYGIVFPSKERLWNKDELQLRSKLWELATSAADDGDWILCLDADELLDYEYSGVLKYCTQIAEQNNCDGIGFPLYDMWNDTHYRDDQYWTAHKRHWIMCVRYHKDKDYKWYDMKLHCGRFPQNVCGNFIGVSTRIKHMGWSNPEERKRKYQLYMETDPEGKCGILAHYESILDENPNLVRFV